jgi:hypothetical protein
MFTRVMEKGAACYSESSVNIYQTTHHRAPEDCCFQHNFRNSL